MSSRGEETTILKKNPLEFTGNWFIDAGILGFVNLMEEVYGRKWKNSEKNFLDILIEKLSGLSRNEIYNIFTYAFWYKTIKDTTLRWTQKDNFRKKDIKDQFKIAPEELTKNIEKNVSKHIDKHLENTSTITTKKNKEVYSLIIEFNNSLKKILKNSYSPYKHALRKIYASMKKTIIGNIDSIGLIAYNSFFTNLSFFNPSSNKSGKEKDILKQQFENLLNNYFVRKDKKIKSLPTSLFDKSLSPFIYSASDFNNQLYGKPQTLQDIEGIFGINPVYYILSFPFAFIGIMEKYYIFYAPDLKFTYIVNRELKYFIERDKENERKSVLEITWDTVLDKINEYKAISSLENMYIIEYSGIPQQQIQNVEYIGISKLSASLIIDDHIRKYLNKRIPTTKKDKNKKTIWVWLLKEFIKNKSPTPHIINYVYGIISDNWKKNEKKVGKYTLITSLAVDAEIKKMKSRVYGKRIFDTDFFSSYKNVVDNVKNTISTMYLNQKVAQTIAKKDDKIKIGTSLLGYVKSRDRYGFVNLLLKHMIGKTSQSDKEKGLLVNYLFNNVLSNDICWENYSLSIIIGIIYGGEKNGK